VGIQSPHGEGPEGVRLDFEGISGTAGERQEMAGSRQEMAGRRQETGDNRSERGTRTQAWGDDSRSGASVERKSDVENRDGEASTLSSEGGIVVSGGSAEVSPLSPLSLSGTTVRPLCHHYHNYVIQSSLLVGVFVSFTLAHHDRDPLGHTPGPKDQWAYPPFIYIIDAL
jgi:hypothetical protein